jgi:hypothetical protein
LIDPDTPDVAGITFSIVVFGVWTARRLILPIPPIFVTILNPVSLYNSFMLGGIESLQYASILLLYSEVHSAISKVVFDLKNVTWDNDCQSAQSLSRSWRLKLSEKLEFDSQIDRKKRKKLVVDLLALNTGFFSRRT